MDVGMFDIPRIATSRRKEVSSGAFILYVFYCQYRETDHEKFLYGVADVESTQLILELDCSYTRLSALLHELIDHSWVRKVGQKVIPFLGFEDRQPDYSLLKRRKVIKNKKNASYNDSYGKQELSDELQNVPDYQTQSSQKREEPVITKKQEVLENENKSTGTEIAVLRNNILKPLLLAAPEPKKPLEFKLPPGWTLEEFQLYREIVECLQADNCQGLRDIPRFVNGFLKKWDGDRLEYLQEIDAALDGVGLPSEYALFTEWRKCFRITLYRFRNSGERDPMTEGRKAQAAPKGGDMSVMDSLEETSYWGEFKRPRKEAS